MSADDVPGAGPAVPPSMREGAQSARLGRLRAVDQAPSPVGKVVRTLVVVVAAVVVSIGIAALIGSQGAPEALRYVALLALFLAFVPFSRALRDLVVGADTTCVHDRGVALGNKRGCVPVPWRGVESVERLRAGDFGSTLLGWNLHGKDGTTRRVLLHGPPQQRAELATALERSAAGGKVAITEQG